MIAHVGGMPLEEIALALTGRVGVDDRALAARGRDQAVADALVA